jgi:UDP-N-acetylglucosamine 2-epimerase (non-hydrolysing)
MVVKPVVAVVFGTRPEAVKMVPVIQALRNLDAIGTVTISTGQHREMLKPILERFRIEVDFEMELMEPNQSLYRLSSKAIGAFEHILSKCKPSLLLVQGDTTTAFLGGLCAFYGKIPVGHVEAGLRTDNKYFPFPEEMNRRLITALADLNFAPTKGNRQNLLLEGISPRTIHITGNTGIDTLILASRMKMPPVFPSINLKNKRLVLVTIHRRESFGYVMEGIFHGLRDIAERHDDVEIVYPVHLNPNVRRPAHEILGNVQNIHLVEPMEYFDFVNAMKKAYLVLTDSGGIQEEAPTLGVPVLVVRNETERPEAVEAGTVRLVGTSRKKIAKETSKILDHKEERLKLTRAANPYGDGKAAQRIAGHVKRFLLSR